MKKIIYIFLLTIFVFLGFNLKGEDHKGYSIFGVFQTRYSYSVSNENNHNFYLGRNGVGLDGAINEYTGYRIIIFADRENKIAPFDIFGRLNIIPKTEIRIGQFKQPFSMERLISFTKRDLINNAIATDFVQSRDFGIGFFGQTKYVSYDLSVINGTGLNEFEENSKKDFIGRIVLKPFNRLKIGGGVYLGKSGPDSILLDKNYYNLQLEYKTDKIHLMSEYVFGEETQIKKWSYYFLGGYKISINNKYLEIIEPILRYELYDRNIDIEDNKQNLLTIGLNCYFDKDNFKLQVNHQRTFNEEFEKTKDEFLLNLQLMFSL